MDESNDDLEARLDTLGVLPVPPRPSESALGTSAPSRRPFLAAAAAVVLLLIGGVVLARRDAGTSETVQVSNTPPGTEDRGSWRPIAASPLSARDGSTAVWTGTEMLVFGGSETPLCDGGSVECPPPTPVSSGAAYDPTTDRWRAIAPAPAPLLGAETHWAGDRAIVYQPAGISDPRKTPAGADPIDQLYSYDPAADSWRVLSSPPRVLFDPDRVPRVLLARAALVDGLLHFAAPTRGEGDQPVDLAYDIDSDRWTDIPLDTLGPATNRRYVTVDGRAFLFATPDAARGTDRPTKVAVLQLRRGFWAGVQPLDGIPAMGTAWYGSGRFAVNFGGRSRVSGRGPSATTSPSRSWVFTVPGGSLEGTAVSLRDPTPQVEDGAALPEVADAGEWLIPGGPFLYRPDTETWLAVPELPTPGQRPATGVWTGTALIVWGGGIGSPTPDQALTAAGAVFTPPGTDPSGPATTDRTTPDGTDPDPTETAPTTTPTSAPTTSPSDSGDGWIRALTELGVDVADAPEPVRSIGAAQVCGVVKADHLGNSTGDEQISCFIDAHLARQPAVLAIQNISVEGDPIVTVFRTGADGVIEDYHDATRDRFGSGTWSARTCRWLSATPTENPVVYEDATEPLISLGLYAETCSGDDDGLPGAIEPFPMRDLGPRQDLPPFAHAEPPMHRCGLVNANRGIADPHRTCFEDALTNGTPAELTVIAHDDTGGTRVEWLRILADGTNERVSRDYPGADRDRPWVHERCASLALVAPEDRGGPGARPVTATGCELLIDP